MLYVVTWGPITETVEAPNEIDAWACFCDKLAPVDSRPQKKPELYDRVIELAPEPEPDPE